MIPLRYNLRSLTVRRTTSLMTAMGVALVVMILVILSGLIAGLRSTVLGASERGNWIVLARGMTSEPGSYISYEQYELIRSRPEVAADRTLALVSPEAVTGFFATPDEPNVNFTFLRGVYPEAYRVHRNMRVVSGRWPTRGRSEMIVGRKLLARVPALAPGRQIRFGRRTWTVVGAFSDNDSARESEVWTDLDVLRQDMGYPNGGFASIHVVLKPGMEGAFKHALDNDARLRVDAETEAEFYSQESEFAEQLRGLGLVIVVILGLGATFGGMNTMYAAVARRGREVGVLRALGFTRGNVLASFVIESIAIGIAGGLIGEILAVVVATAIGLNSRLMNVGEFIFSFRLTFGTFVSGIIAAAIIGGFGGLLPALRAARTGVMEGLRTA
ncbi:MAG: ABC transporter permease [Candidatus Binataceae bacterium]